MQSAQGVTIRHDLQENVISSNQIVRVETLLRKSHFKLL